MLSTFLTAVLTVTIAMIVITCFWVAVQRMWYARFPDQQSASDDALANRSGCHGCNCERSNCQRDKQTLNDLHTEASPDAP